jgi:chemotaxis protein MotB
MAAREFIAHSEDEESYFVSMTDVVIGLLFIFIIMLMFFAMRFQEATQEQKKATEKQNVLIDDLSDAEKARSDLLEGMGKFLKDAGMHVIVVKNEGILRIPEEILFETSEWELNKKGSEAVQTVAKALDLVLPCYTVGPRSKTDGCPATKAKVEAIFIEGHADSRPFVPKQRRGPNTTSNSALPPAEQRRGQAAMPNAFLPPAEQRGLFFRRPAVAEPTQSDQRRPVNVTVPREAPKDNLDLSALRATSTFRELLKVDPLLSEYRSPSNSRVLSVSGYGEYRPVAREEGESIDRYNQRNRRIDLRVLMATPKSEDVKQMQRDLQQFEPAR